MSERLIIRDAVAKQSICCDLIDEGALVSTQTDDHMFEEQFFVSLASMRRLGEWLIERANAAGER